MARDLDLLPGRKPAVGLLELTLDLGLQLSDLVGDVDVAAGGQVPQLFDLAFELGDRPFDIAKMSHGCAVIPGGPVPRKGMVLGNEPAPPPADHLKRKSVE